MNTQGVKRKLTAMLSADVVGYSRLMGEDDEATVRTLGEYREVIANYIIRYRGRVVDSPGDNLLAEFASVVDAVQCAAEIQRELAERNSEIPDARKMQYRIGVNLGDVIQEGERIYGDGVNVAARLESLAEPGGVCISGIAHDQVKNKLNLEYQFVGNKTVKNIKEPVRVYRVLSFPGAAAHRVVRAKRAVGRTWRHVVLAMGAVIILGGGALAIWHLYLRPAPPRQEVASEQPPTPESAEQAPPPIPAQPSIAVLPFTNISGDQKEDYLSDGITEQIITALSKIPRMLVIARNSVFTYKGKPVMVQEVSEELGVRYVLEGSVQKSGEKLRVTAQLIDAKTGNHLWSERYDRNLKDLFDLQDDITKNVIMALQVKLTEGETARLLGVGTKNLEAYLKVMEGLHYFLHLNKDDNERARQLSEKARALDPNYTSAYIMLAWTYFEDALFGWTKTPAESYAKAIEMARESISLGGETASAHMILANVYAKMGQFEKALAAGKKGLSLDPANPLQNAHYGTVLNRAGRFEEAIPFLEKAIRTDPKPRWYLGELGLSYNKTGQFKEAIQFLEKAIRADPNLASVYVAQLGWAYFWTGQDEKAISAFKESVNREPKNAFTHGSLGCAYIAIGEPQKAVEMFEKASALNPDSKIWFISSFATARYLMGHTEEAAASLREVLSRHPDNADAYRGLAMVLNYEGKYEEALPMAKKAVRLRPAPETYDYQWLGTTHLMIGENEEAIAALKKSIGVSADNIYGNIWLTAAYSLAGRMEEARSQAGEVLRINPEITLDDIAKNGYNSLKKADKERFIDALRKAGLK